MDVKCDCYDTRERKFMDGHTENDDCPLCKDGVCTADEISLSFDGHGWSVSCPKG